MRTRLIKVQSKHPVKQVGLTIHSKTFLVKNTDNIKHKMQKPCNENPSLKSTDLPQTQMLIESWSIFTALVHYSLRFSQVNQYYNNSKISKPTILINIMLLSLKKNKRNIKKKWNGKKIIQRRKKENGTIKRPCLHNRWGCYQAIALNDQHVGSKSLAPLSP